MFTSINKEEHELADTFLNDEKVRVKDEMVPDGGLLLAIADDSDEEMRSVASGDDEEPRVGGPVTMMTTAKTVDKDFQALSSDDVSPTESSPGDEGGPTASDAPGDRDMIKKGPKKVKAKARDGDDKGNASPAKKIKKAGGDGEKDAKKARVYIRGKESKDGQRLGRCDGSRLEKPTPKPKLRPKAITKGSKGDEDEPARKEQKGAEENGRLMSTLSR